MKKQTLSIEIVDARRDPPVVRRKTFTNHQAYLHAMGRIGRMTGVHLHEETTSRVTIYKEQTVPDLFE